MVLHFRLDSGSLFPEIFIESRALHKPPLEDNAHGVADQPNPALAPIYKGAIFARRRFQKNPVDVEKMSVSQLPLNFDDWRTDGA
jgi:hypothetical protein